ncbi:MAG: Holliday junction resolvase RuvX [Planctomycetota bacterium]
MRHLAIDYGTRRVGLALSDEGGQFVNPLAVLQVGNDDDARRQVVAAARREDAQVLVVGLPLNMDGTEGPSAVNVRKWASAVADELTITLVLVDERLTSFEAEQTLAARRRGGERLTHKGKKRRLDAVAAAGFLQQYLDGELTALETRHPTDAGKQVTGSEPARDD